MADKKEGEEKATKTKALTRLIKNITVRTLWIYVLAVLKDNPTYPYQVKKSIREKFSFNPPTVTLYTVMYRLEREGLIRKNEHGAYEVTGLGLEALKEAAQLLAEVSRKLTDMTSEGPR